MIGKGNVLISDCIGSTFCSEYKLKFVELILALCKKNTSDRASSVPTEEFYQIYFENKKLKGINLPHQRM